jgi:hypothetical protein
MAATNPTNAQALHSSSLPSAAHRPRRRRRHPPGDTWSVILPERRSLLGDSPPPTPSTTAPQLPPCLHPGTPQSSLVNALHILTTIPTCSSPSTQYAPHSKAPHNMPHAILPCPSHPHITETQVAHTNETNTVLNLTIYQHATAPDSLLHRSRYRTNTAGECSQHAARPLRWLILDIPPHRISNPPH